MPKEPTALRALNLSPNKLNIKYIKSEYLVPLLNFNLEMLNALKFFVLQNSNKVIIKTTQKRFKNVNDNDCNEPDFIEGLLKMELKSKPNIKFLGIFSFADQKSLGNIAKHKSIYANLDLLRIFI